MTKEFCKRIRAEFSVCIEKEKFDSIQTQANRIKRFYNIWMHIRETKFKKTQNVNLKLPKRIFICITGHWIVMFPRSSYYSDFSITLFYLLTSYLKWDLQLARWKGDHKAYFNHKAIFFDYIFWSLLWNEIFAKKITFIFFIISHKNRKLIFCWHGFPQGSIVTTIVPVFWKDYILLGKHSQHLRPIAVRRCYSILIWW